MNTRTSIQPARTIAGVRFPTVSGSLMFGNRIIEKYGVSRRGINLPALFLLKQVRNRSAGGMTSIPAGNTISLNLNFFYQFYGLEEKSKSIGLPALLPFSANLAQGPKNSFYRDGGLPFFEAERLKGFCVQTFYRHAMNTNGYSRPWDESHGYTHSASTRRRNRNPFPATIGFFCHPLAPVTFREGLVDGESGSLEPSCLKLSHLRQMRRWGRFNKMEGEESAGTTSPRSGRVPVAVGFIPRGGETRFSHHRMAIACVDKNTHNTFSRFVTKTLLPSDDPGDELPGYKHSVPAGRNSIIERGSFKCFVPYHGSTSFSQPAQSLLSRQERKEKSKSRQTAPHDPIKSHLTDISHDGISMPGIRLTPVTRSLSHMTAGKGGNTTAEIRRYEHKPMQGYRMRRISAANAPFSHPDVDSAFNGPIQPHAFADGQTTGPAGEDRPILVHKRREAAPGGPHTGVTGSLQHVDNVIGPQGQTLIMDKSDLFQDATGSGKFRTDVLSELTASGPQTEVPPAEMKRVADSVYKMIEKRIMIERERRGM